MEVSVDPRLDADCGPLGHLELCSIGLMKDSRWPWLVLIPARPGLSELHDLTELDAGLAMMEMRLVSRVLKDVTGCEKINCAAIGNIVRQLHIHIIARRSGDPNWPGPVWGYGEAEPYSKSGLIELSESIQQALAREKNFHVHKF